MHEGTVREAGVLSSTIEKLSFQYKCRCSCRKIVVMDKSARRYISAASEIKGKTAFSRRELKYRIDQIED
jgi:hypothetical protein